MPGSKVEDGPEPLQSCGFHSQRPCSFRAAVQVVLALQRLRGGLNPSVSYTERSASRQPTTRWVRKTPSSKDLQVNAEQSTQTHPDSSAASVRHENSGFGSRPGQRRSDLLFHPLPPTQLELQQEDAARATQPRPTVRVSATA